MVYYRLYITYTLAGFLFDLDQSNIYRNIQKIKSLMKMHIPIPQKMYHVAKRIQTPEEVEKHFPRFLSFIDCTEQPIPRPLDKDRRKMYYSGKKKRHKIKNQIMMVNNRGYILYKVAIRKKKRHDHDIYKTNHPVAPKQIVNVLDLG
ncbi:MAG: transposase [Thermoproteota archaeon]|nr:transposase [Thermoproteota archaeon]